MLVNFFFLFFLYLFFVSLGVLFQKKLIDHKISKDFNFFEKIFFGIFLLSLITLFFNFFVKLHNLFFLIFLFLIFIYSIFKFSILIKKDIKKIFLFSLIFSPLSTYLNFGYDAGLYHIPFQLILQNDQINFGLANLHMRYGLTTIHSYLSSLFWYNNFFNIVSCFSTIIFSLLFIFILEKLKNKNVIDSIFVISALITFPLWYRFAELYISLVDIVFTLFFYFTFYYGVKIIFYRKAYNQEFKKKIFLFLLLLSFTISTKPTAVLLIVYLLLIVILKYKIFLQNIIEIIKNNILSLSFFCFWIVRNLIISSCFFYPIKMSCLNLSWKTNSLETVNYSIKTWNSLVFKSFFQVLLNNQLLMILIIFIILLSFFYLKKVFNFVIKNRKSLILPATIILILLTIFIQPLKLVAHLIETNQKELLKIIYFKEIFFTLSFYLLGVFSIILISKKKIILNKLRDINFNNIIPVLFFLINFFIWIIFGPNPRLGQNLFLIIIPVFFILLINLRKFSVYNYSKYFKFFIFLVIVKISIFQNLEKINLNSIFFLKKTVPEVKLNKRESFGFYPKNIENLCWIGKNCYPYSDVKIYNVYSNYKFFKEIKN